MMVCGFSLGKKLQSRSKPEHVDQLLGSCVLVIWDKEGVLDPSASLNTDQEKLEEAPGPCSSEHPGACSPGFGGTSTIGLLLSCFFSKAIAIAAKRFFQLP